MKFIGNDTVALVFLGIVAIIGVVMRDSTVTATALGGIAGYIGGSKSKEL